MAFDKSCDFLLDRQFYELFEETGPENATTWRCKGCGAEIGKTERRAHHARHRAGRTRSQNAAERKRRQALEVQLANAREMRRRLAEE